MSVLSLAACGDGNPLGGSDSSLVTLGTQPVGGTTATGTPIVVGAVASLSGVDTFPEPSAAAQAVFAHVNRAGGIKGHPIIYKVEDDQDTPEGAAIAAKRLIEEEQVLTMVGGGSIVDCTTNAKYYGEVGVLSLAGVNACGPDAANVASLNTGPFLGAMMTLSYLYSDLGLRNVCFSGLNTGLTPLFQEIYIPAWEAVTGYKLKEFILSEPSEDLTPAVTKAAQDGCDGVLLAYTEPNYIAYAHLAEAQGLLGGDIVYAMLTSGYDLSVLDKLGPAGEGWYSNSEFLPFTEDAATSPDLAEFKETTKRAGLAETSFAQGGYLAAQILVDVLESIEGEYTRESVNGALKQMDYKTDLLGQAATWVPYQGTNQLNTTSKIVQIQNGEFVTRTDWLSWPPTG